MIRVLALLHVVLVTTGAMDSSWAMAKSLGMSHSQIPKMEVLERPGPFREAKAASMGDRHLTQ